MLVRMKVIFIVLFVAGTARAGGESGGGANYCWFNDRPILKDLIRDQSDISLEANRGRETPTISESNLMKEFGFDRITIPDGPWQIIVNKKVANLKAHSPRLEKLIRQGLVGLNFYGTMEKPKGPIQADFSTRTPCTWDRVSAGILYWKGLAFAVLPVLNLQSDFSIAASQIHEALRHIQQTFAPIANVNPSNYDLEDLTYLVMHEAPNLDQHSFMQGLATSEGLAEVQKLAVKLCNSSRFTTNDKPEKMLEVNNALNQFCNGSAISVSSDPDEAHRQIRLILGKVNYLRASMMQGTASRKVADRIGQQLHEISLCLTRESFEGRTNEIIDATMKVNLVELNTFLKVLQDEKDLDAASIKRMFFDFIAQIGL